jgi:hypothetical protein
MRKDFYKLWLILIVTFVCVLAFEYYTNSWVGTSAVIVGYIFGWHGKKWYNDIVELKNEYQ